MEKEKDENKGRRNKGMYVIRIKVQPFNSNFSYSIEYNRTGRSPEYEIYKFD